MFGSNYSTVLVIVVTLLLICYLVLLANNRIFEQHNLKGFWVADAEFCNTAGLSDFMLYIGDGIYCKTGYLFVTNPDGVIVNDPVKISFKKAVNLFPFIMEEQKFKIRIDWVDHSGYDFLPSEMFLNYYPKQGRVVLSDEDQIYASLFKNNEMTHAASEYAKEQEKIAKQREKEAAEMRKKIHMFSDGSGDYIGEYALEQRATMAAVENIPGEPHVVPGTYGIIQPTKASKK